MRLVFARLETGALLSALTVALIFSFWTRNFLSIESITSILIVTSEMAILATAVTLLMIAGEFDLSVGSVLGVSSVAVPLLIVNCHFEAVPALFAAVFIALAIGFLHGSLVKQLRIASFIVTLGGLMFWRGVIFVATQGFPIRVPRADGSVFSIFSHRFANGFDVRSFGCSRGQSFSMCFWLTRSLAIGFTHRVAMSVPLEPWACRSTACVLSSSF
jgi:ribose/xylose/arabinose/galactoside ABC-type transport system permease subunit